MSVALLELAAATLGELVDEVVSVGGPTVPGQPWRRLPAGVGRLTGFERGGHNHQADHAPAGLPRAGILGTGEM